HAVGGDLGLEVEAAGAHGRDGEQAVGLGLDAGGEGEVRHGEARDAVVLGGFVVGVAVRDRPALVVPAEARGAGSFVAVGDAGGVPAGGGGLPGRGEAREAGALRGRVEAVEDGLPGGALHALGLAGDAP